MTQHATQLSQFLDMVRSTAAPDVTDYWSLWRWSSTDITAFWDSVRRYFDISFDTPPETILTADTMPGAQWFPGATLSYSAHVFRHATSERPAMIAVHEAANTEVWSWSRLEREVAGFARHLRDVGIQPGDRVVGYLPNIPEAVVAFLATASLGGVWSVCNQDVAPSGVISRFAQLRPSVLVATAGCRYGGKDHDRVDVISTIRDQLPTLTSTVLVDPPDRTALPRDTVSWADAISADALLSHRVVPFEHPLWVLFSSGTTGAPKGIVHGHGGILLEQLKFQAFHLDLNASDTFFWYASTTWVMWNVVASALLTGATIVTYDGSPTYPGPERLWRIAAEHGVTVLGVSPAYLQGCISGNVDPAAPNLARLRQVGCTGSPLAASSYDWLHHTLGAHTRVNSLSGGTDVAGAFVAGNPLLRTRRDEISGPCLGVAIQAWDETGRPVVDRVGELVITRPLPSMPLYLWDDRDGSRYRAAYFDTFPGVWRHGDWITITEHGGVIVHGRSDATLNRAGVRLGSAEIYAAVEAIDLVQEALVVGIEEPGGNYWLPLFVHLADGITLDDELTRRIINVIKMHASPRHVPDEIIQVPGIPHTLTGKRLEVPIKRILMGATVEDALNVAAVADPTLLEPFCALSAQRSHLRHQHPSRR